MHDSYFLKHLDSEGVGKVRRRDSHEHGKGTQATENLGCGSMSLVPLLPGGGASVKPTGGTFREQATAGLRPETAHPLGSPGKRNSPASAFPALYLGPFTQHSVSRLCSAHSSASRLASSGPHCPRAVTAASESQSVRATQQPKQNTAIVP